MMEDHSTRTYKVELDPNDVQKTAFMRHAGAARYAYNWGLRRWNELYRISLEEVEVDSKKCSAMSLHKEINVLKKTDYPWMYDVSKCCIQAALQDLEKAYKNFFAKRAKHPQFKSKHRSRISFRTWGSVKITATHIKLPNISKVRLKEHGYVPVGILPQYVTVSQEACGKWFASITLRVPPIVPEPNGSVEIIGLDAGLHSLMVCSDGTVYENPRALNRLLKQIKNTSRKLARQTKGSKRRNRTKKKLAILHYRVRCIRNDAIHKMTTQLVRTKRPKAVVIEDLNVKGMVKNRKLTRSISDAAWGEIRRQLAYKCQWYGVEFILANRWFASTKTCSGCGAKKPEMDLGERTYVCSCCGLVLDRDLNASYNLRDYPMKQQGMTAASSAGYGRGATVRPKIGAKRQSKARCCETSTRQHEQSCVSS